MACSGIHDLRIMAYHSIRNIHSRRGDTVKEWLTVREASEIFGLSMRYLHYLARGRPETNERNAKPPVLRKIKEIAYGQKSMYLLNYHELKKLIGVRDETHSTNR